MKIQPAWNTSLFIKIKLKKTQSLSQSEIWDKEELLTIIKYEQSKRNKVDLALFWNLDTRNYEITLLKIKNIRLSEIWKYGNMEIWKYGNYSNYLKKDCSRIYKIQNTEGQSN